MEGGDPSVTNVSEVRLLVTSTFCISLEFIAVALNQLELFQWYLAVSWQQRVANISNKPVR